jgi:hypothetical protein
MPLGLVSVVDRLDSIPCSALIRSTAFDRVVVPHDRRGDPGVRIASLGPMTGEAWRPQSSAVSVQETRADCTTPLPYSCLAAGS